MLKLTDANTGITPKFLCGNYEGCIMLSSRNSFAFELSLNAFYHY